jgi:hypothetical protein
MTLSAAGESVNHTANNIYIDSTLCFDIFLSSAYQAPWYYDSFFQQIVFCCKDRLITTSFSNRNIFPLSTERFLLPKKVVVVAVLPQEDRICLRINISFLSGTMTVILQSPAKRNLDSHMFKSDWAAIICADAKPRTITGHKRFLRDIGLPARLRGLFVSLVRSPVSVARAETGTDSDGRRQKYGGEPIPPFPAAVLFLLGVPALLRSWFRGPNWLLPVGWLCTVVGAVEFGLWLFPPP